MADPIIVLALFPAAVLLFALVEAHTPEQKPIRMKARREDDRKRGR